AIRPKHNKNFYLWRSTAAAVIFIVAIFSAYYYRTNRIKIAQEHIAENIKPGGNRATLTLANGTIIVLDSANNGKLAEQNGIIITKTTDGQLIYTLSNEQDAEPKFNTISTPKGGQYQIHLPDGSKVWLNAESSLKYPTFFTGKERVVTLTGEAYFEVSKAAKHSKMPFVVFAEDQTVTVLGTHFNINAYRNEYVSKTTLLEGSVQVSCLWKDYGKTVVLRPGEQSNVDRRGLSVETVDAEDAIAWKNGVFLFKDADINTVMKSIARWYNVEVRYEGLMPNRQFSGEIHRNLNLKQVLEILSFYKVHFRTEGNTITVTP
ncbi:MAG: DUF4974 domain-containing protein, partial [Pedobacter sp.]